MKLQILIIVIIVFILIVPSNIHAKKDSIKKSNVEHGLGLVPEKPNVSNVVPRVTPTNKSVDVKYLSKVDNSEYLPPIGDQGAENSCVGWAMGYYLKGYQEIREHGWNKYDSKHWMSPYFVYNLINGGFDNGSFLSDAAELIVKVGVSPYEDFISSNHHSWPGKRAFFDASKYRAEDYHWIQGIDNLRQLLANGKVAVISIYVWDNFINIQNYGNVYTVADVHGYNHGGHAVIVVGYDDNKYTKDGFGAFKLANSWGVGWGDNGFFWMSYRAFLTSYVCTGWAIYLDDKTDYSPETVVAVKINHTSRGDVLKNGISVEYKNRSMRFLYFPNIYSYIKREGLGDDYQHYPFSDDYMVFDITDIASNVTFGDEVHIMLNDTIPGNVGSVESVQIYYLPKKSSAEYNFDIVIPDNGECVTVWAKIIKGFHTPIIIKEDQDFYELNAVFSGKGTVMDPYVIDNCSIDAEGGNYGINLEFTTSAFIIKNCIIYNVTSSRYTPGIGINLLYVQNGVVKNNTISNANIGISLKGSKNNVVMGNIIEARIHGIYVVGNYYNRIENNTLNGYPIYYYHDASDIQISNMRVGEITLAKCNKFTIDNVKIYGGGGIRILDSIDGVVENFHINGTTGIEINKSLSVSVERGVVNDSLIHGGIWIISSRIIYVKDVIAENSYNGFYVAYSRNVSISNCNTMKNIYNGIYVIESSVEIEKCTIGENTIDGIHILSSSFSKITMNRIFSNLRYGIMIYESSYVDVVGNKIENNSDYGVYLSQSNNCTVHGNYFYFNRGSNRTFNITHIQAYDDGNNSWNTTKGNFWEDWIRVDKNQDGIVDMPYQIDGPSHNFDYRPLMPHSKEDYTAAYAIISGVILIIFLLSILRRKKLM